MVSWVTEFIQSAGYPALALLMMIENLFPPIPSELIMPLGGYLAAQGEMNIMWAVVAGTIGSVAGALPVYWLGAKLGPDRLERWADEHGRWLTISGEDIVKARKFFERRGVPAIFLGRLVPGVRSVIALPAGASHMPMVKFLLATTVGAAVWAGALAAAGYLLGTRFREVSKWMDMAGWVVLGAILLWYLWRVVKHKGRKARTA